MFRIKRRVVIIFSGSYCIIHIKRALSDIYSFVLNRFYIIIILFAAIKTKVEMHNTSKYKNKMIMNENYCVFNIVFQK